MKLVIIVYSQRDLQEVLEALEVNNNEIEIHYKEMAKRIILTKEEYAIATMGQDKPKPYSEYLKEMRMTKKDSVNKATIKEMFDFFYDTITDISNESPEYYEAMSSEYDKIMDKFLEA